MIKDLASSGFCLFPCFPFLDHTILDIQLTLNIAQVFWAINNESIQEKFDETGSRLAGKVMAKVGIFHSLRKSYGKPVIRH